MKKINLVLFGLIFFSASFGQKTIKMKRQGGVSVIDCKVNGLNLSFIFDTGASDVSLSLTEAQFMLKNNYLSKSDIIGTSNYVDANGDISEGYVIILRKIEFSGFTMYNVRASVVKNLNAPLLLGQSAISKLGKIQLDLNANTITILNPVSSYDYSSTFKIIKSSETSTIYTFRIVLKEYNNVAAATVAFDKLTSYGHKLLLYTKDYSIYKLALQFDRPISYSTQVKDSVQEVFGGNPYIETN